ncbi:hypothetical protein [Paraburkholderia humisilvae]|uniref:Uncharacterized protein n=1 Tax=Paraburkholderia humisilvae TaxID=627669 RepID=A0A6J5CYN6_9BURK|nr:hypothetical protein [Paraburkholderia humisilvae]CAB3745965.1 hypothetical protein LMG29542_00089 [Paraburkholderia humisilvae]
MSALYRVNLERRRPVVPQIIGQRTIPSQHGYRASVFSGGLL